MTTTSRPTATPLRLSTVATSTRRAPKTGFGPVMHQSVLRAANTVQSGLVAAGPHLPGGAVLAAAVAGVTSDPEGAAPLGGGDSAFRYLELQQQIQEETRAFTLASNILKARHDAAKNALTNLR